SLVSLRPTRLVIAGGGVETTRLLLAAQRNQPKAFGGVDGPLGRYYMGHLSGKIADIVFKHPDDAGLHDFFLDGDAYVRRPLTLAEVAMRQNGLQNIAFWADNPRFFDARHRDPLLSLVWLALATPGLGPRLASEGVRQSHLGPFPRRPAPHVLNLLRRPHRALA